MIMDHTIGSARAEKRKNSTQRLWRRLLTASLASALAMPSLAAWGLNSPPRTTAIPAYVRPPPPIAHLESMRWMQWKAEAPRLRIDILMSPNVTPWGILQPGQDRTQRCPTLS